MKKLNILSVCTVALLTTLTATAQTPSDNHPTILLSARSTSLGYNDTTLHLNVLSNVDYTATPADNWVRVEKRDKKVALHVAMNTTSTPRSTRVTFASPDGTVQRTYSISQERENTAETLIGDIQIPVISAQASETQSGSNIVNTYDGKNSTIWHSTYNGNISTTEFPVTLDYQLDAEHIDYLIYQPRPAASTNGNFKEVEIWYSLTDQNGFTKLGDYDMKGSTISSRISLGKNGTDNVDSVRFIVKSGVGDFAACAEMKFFRNQTDPSYTIFADELWTTLQEGTTQADIDALENPFSKLLAQQIFDGTYHTRWRVASYPAKLHPSVLSERWKAPGKLYDQMDGPTGINITKGKTAVIVSGIPEGMSATLKVVAWFAGEVNSEGVGVGPASYEYPLQNGRNIIEYNSNYDGLAYVCYYVYDDPKEYPAINVHFANAQVNGYLHPELTNEEMHELCKNAPNTCMDVYGSKVHSVWTSQGLYKYCKASDGVSIGYRQYMNVLDSLVAWEHRLLGFEKYNSVPENRTMAYVNYTYYMFQGGWGVSFMYDQESRVLNCRTLMYNDDDAIWGLSHEWGHLHQMHPYLCWAGTAEITNNLNSYYNIMHMGYYRSDKINQWEPARQNFIYNKNARSGDGVLRKQAYEWADNFSYSPELREQCLKMEPYRDITRYPAANGADSAYAISFFECGGGQGLCPFIMLYNWATLTQGNEDFGPDMYEALRQTEAENGSVIEKQNGIDKYELLACAQNSNKNGAWGKYQEKYPESCWTVGHYITESQCNWQLNSAPAVLNWIRKCSRLTGYNLFPYFEAWGFLRQVALRIDDYGFKNFVLTEKAYKEFKADMDALVESGELQAMPDGLVRTISTTRDLNLQNDILFPTPNIPN